MCMSFTPNCIFNSSCLLAFCTTWSKFVPMQFCLLVANSTRLYGIQQCWSLRPRKNATWSPRASCSSALDSVSACVKTAHGSKMSRWPFSGNHAVHHYTLQLFWSLCSFIRAAICQLLSGLIVPMRMASWRTWIKPGYAIKSVTPEAMHRPRSLLRIWQVWSKKLL